MRRLLKWLIRWVSASLCGVPVLRAVKAAPGPGCQCGWPFEVSYLWRVAARAGTRRCGEEEGCGGRGCGAVGRLGLGDAYFVLGARVTGGCAAPHGLQVYKPLEAASGGCWPGRRLVVARSLRVCDGRLTPWLPCRLAAPGRHHGPAPSLAWPCAAPWHCLARGGTVALPRALPGPGLFLATAGGWWNATASIYFHRIYDALQALQMAKFQN